MQFTLAALKQQPAPAQRVFTDNSNLQQSKISEKPRKAWSKKYLPSVEENWIKERLNKLDVHKSMGPDRMNAHVLKDPGDVTTRALNCLGKVVVIRRCSCGLEENKYHSYLQEGQERETIDWSASPQSWEGHGANQPGSCFQLF